MTVIMFWNVKRSTATPHLPAACLEHDVDILILAEEKTDRSSLENSLSASGAGNYVEYAPIQSDIRFFTRLPVSMFSALGDSGSRMSIRKLCQPGKPPLNIAAVHAPSKLHLSDADQYSIIRMYRRSIESAESSSGSKNSILIGDMNMNPFEPGMTAHDGFHGAMTKKIASKKSRKFASEDFSYFYNPMWSRMGDDSLGPPGTYYYSASSSIDHRWNTFDQVLLRPELLDQYKVENLKVLDSVGSRSLLKRDRIDKSVSDHLPIVISLEI